MVILETINVLYDTNYFFVLIECIKKESRSIIFKNDALIVFEKKTLNRQLNTIQCLKSHVPSTLSVILEY